MNLALIPSATPGPGEQYAFEIDLDECTGCKSCVTACHSINRLDEGETWRAVGLLHGGDADSPALQTVTSACHHCLEPACMTGCPAVAYTKDPTTGIVIHMADRCIGCQYCTFTCPYDVPQFNPARGIVRKCDMCTDRLSGGDPPACVQGCPNGALSIRIAREQDIVGDAEARAFLPGAPDPALTLPATLYRSTVPLPRNALPADYHAVRPTASHPPLVLMLVLTQLSVGAFVVAQLVGAHGALMSWTSLAVGVGALGASVFHLGRPRRAYRAVLGLRHSWLSREIVAFTVFSGLAFANAAIALPRLGTVAAASGAIAVATSVMVYAATGRECWSVPITGFKFITSAAALGVVTVLALHATSRHAPTLAAVLIATAVLKLSVETGLLLRVRDRRPSAHKRSAALALGQLPRVTFARFAFGVAGGVVLPLLYLAIHRGPDVGPAFSTILCAAAGALLLAGELCERFLFFAAQVAPRMPGARA